MLVLSVLGNAAVGKLP